MLRIPVPLNHKKRVLESHAPTVYVVPVSPNRSALQELPRSASPIGLSAASPKVKALVAAGCLILVALVLSFL